MIKRPKSMQGDRSKFSLLEFIGQSLELIDVPVCADKFALQELGLRGCEPYVKVSRQIHCVVSIYSNQGSGLIRVSTMIREVLQANTVRHVRLDLARLDMDDAD